MISKEDQTMDNLMTGIIMGIEEKRMQFESMLPSLSQKALVRLLKDAAMFPASLPTTSEVEAKALETLMAIKDMQVELAILTLGKKQKENDEQAAKQQEV